MTCRQSKLTSALTTIARCMTGLEDNQVLRLSHLLQDQMPADTPTPTQAQWRAFIDETIASFDAGHLRVTPGSADPRVRLRAARDETPSAERLYAAQRIVARCERAVSAQSDFFTDYARQSGVPVGHASTAFWQHFQEASDNARLGPSRAFETSFRNNPDNAALFQDRRSVYAYERMAIDQQTRATSEQTRPAVARQQVDGSTAIAEMGYDPLSQRLEIVMHSNPDRVYAYRVPEDVWDELSTTHSPGRVFARQIRNQRDFQYESQEEAEAHSVQHRCATCGQWAAASGHYCPTTGSEEELNADIRHAVQRARAQAAGLPEPSQEAAVRRMPAGRTRQFPTGDGTLRLAYPNRIRQEARASDQVNVPVVFSTPDGELVTGLAQVDYLGRGRGYLANPVTEPGDSGTDHLQCTCMDYRRARRCSHIVSALAQTNALLNGTEAASPQAAATAAATATAQVADSHAASVASIAVATDNWRGLNTSFADDPTIFQEIYDEARRARTEWKASLDAGEDDDLDYPVPYVRENAFGGLATRESGRGFGIELEYGFPPNMTYDEIAQANQAIGRDLHALRLTRSARQAGYGSSHGVYRDQHERGWSFESDPSVNGGEIVSPVMFDEPDTWANIEKVCEVVRRHGGEAHTRAGMHVHVGVGDYDHTVENHNRLLALVQQNEDVLYRLSTEPDRGRHRGMVYCSPNEMHRGPYQSISMASRHNSGHDIAVNLQSVRGDRGDHVEFRTFDSTLRPGAIQTQIGLAVLFSEAALRPDTIDVSAGERHPVGERLGENPRRGTLTGDAWNESTLGTRRMIDTLVPGTAEDDRDNTMARQIVSLFAMTKWQRHRWS